jgi:hypothetical protein
VPSSARPSHAPRAPHMRRSHRPYEPRGV